MAINFVIRNRTLVIVFIWIHFESKWQFPNTNERKQKRSLFVKTNCGIFSTFFCILRIRSNQLFGFHFYYVYLLFDCLEFSLFNLFLGFCKGFEQENINIIKQQNSNSTQEWVRNTHRVDKWSIGLLKSHLECGMLTEEKGKQQCFWSFRMNDSFRQ